METVMDKKQEIKSVVSEILEIEAEEMTDESLFKEDHSADSLRSIEIMAILEKKFKIKIPETELPKMVNLKGVYEIVEICGGMK